MMRGTTILLIVALATSIAPTPVAAALSQPSSPLPQTDPVAECAEGVRLFKDGKLTEALPLLEAGFAAREDAVFASRDDLGTCALALGLVRGSLGDQAGALEAYTVASDIYHTSGNRDFEGTALNNIGEVYRSQGRYSEALEEFQKALVLWREAGDQIDEGTVLNNIGAVYANQARYEKALEAYRQALAIWREVGDRANEGATLNNIGAVHDAQGRYEDALDFYQQALDIRREVGDRAGEGTTLNNIGFVYDAQAQYDEALDFYQQALAIMQEIGDRVGEGTALNNIGAVHRTQGRYDEALDYYQQALAIAREVGNQAGEAATLNNIGFIYGAQGRYALALEFYQQALAIVREVGDRAGEPPVLNNIGEVYRLQGRYGEALETFQQAVAITREVGDRTNEGTALDNIGKVHHERGRYLEALAEFQQALAIAREVGDRVGEETALSNMGSVYYEQRQYEAALDRYQQALPIQREVGNRAQESVTMNNIGTVQFEREQYAEALEALKQALAIARELGDRPAEGAALNNIGKVHSAQGRYTEALDAYQHALLIARDVGERTIEGRILSNMGSVYQQRLDSDQALFHYEGAMEVADAVRAVSGSEAGRASFIARFAALYAQAVGLYHQLGQDAEAFFASERGRARAFLDSLSTGQVELADDTAADLFAREQEAYAARQAAQDALAKAKALNPPDPKLVADLETQLAAAEQEHDSTLAAIQARGDQLAALVPGRSAVLDLSRVQALLDDQTTLISYYILDDDKTLAFIITHDRLDVVDLKVGRRDLQETIEQFRTLDLADPTRADTHPASLQKLYGWLIAPLKPYLKTPTLGIIPHGVLHYLPFAALTDGQRYLVDDYVLFTLPSASALPFIQKNRKEAADQVLALGDPTTTEPLPALNFAREEVAAMTGSAEAQALLGKAATETALRSQAGTAGLLLLAAHGTYNSANPLYSVIHLAGDAQNDGQLEVREIYGLNLKAATDLVILSACETQLGTLSAGDEVVGLSRAFLYAGTPTVLASLWTVDDESTALLMKQFYAHLREGLNKGQALRQAQMDVRARYPHPYSWAAFVLSGDVGKRSAPGSDYAFILLIALGVLFIGILSIAGWKRFRQDRAGRSDQS